MEKYKTMHQSNIEINPYSVEQQVREQLEYFKIRLLRLEKHEEEYVKIEDVLALFSAKKE